MILCRPGGSVTFCCANALILLRTTSIPRASLAFISNTASLNAAPNISRARHSTDVVLPAATGRQEQAIEQRAQAPAPRQHRDRRFERLTRSRRASYNEIRHISMLRYHLQSRDGVRIADDIAQYFRPMLLHPRKLALSSDRQCRKRRGRGSSGAYTEQGGQRGNESALNRE
jgi:hypothetical protein